MSRLRRVGPVERPGGRRGGRDVERGARSHPCPRQVAARAARLPRALGRRHADGRRGRRHERAPRRPDRPRARARRRDGRRRARDLLAVPEPRALRRGPGGPGQGRRHRAGHHRARRRAARSAALPALLRGVAALLHDARLLAGGTGFDAVQGAIAAQPGGELTFRLDAARFVHDAVPPDDVLLAGLSDDPALRTSTTRPTSTTCAGSHRWRPLCARTASGSSRTRGSRRSSATPASRRPSPASWNASILRPTSAPFGQVVLSPIDATGIRTPLVRVPADPLVLGLQPRPHSRRPATAGRRGASSRPTRRSTVGYATPAACSTR